MGSETVVMDDFKTLAAGTFLNDVIINFYLKYLQYDVFSEADRDRYVLLIVVYILSIYPSLMIFRTHIFTTFWYSRLSQKPSPIEARKDPVVRRYVPNTSSIILIILIILGLVF